MNQLNQIVLEEGAALYKRKKKHESQPQELQQASNDLLEARRALCLLPNRRINPNNFLLQDLQLLFQSWQGVARKLRCHKRLDTLAKQHQQVKTQSMVDEFCYAMGEERLGSHVGGVQAAVWKNAWPKKAKL